MPHVLSSDEDWHFDVKLELHHLEWRSVPVAHEVSDETSIASRC
jgi:hypothetical protein